MYEFTEKEHDRFNSCAFFRHACYQGYADGLTKEELMSKMVMALLDDRDRRDKEELKRALESTNPVLPFKTWSKDD